MKRRAREQGASETEIAGLQRLAVEDTIKGLDINPVSLQLAASQLTAGNQQISYRRMGLHLMPYGPQPITWRRYRQGLWSYWARGPSSPGTANWDSRTTESGLRPYGASGTTLGWKTPWPP